MKELIYIVEDDEGMREVYQGAFEDAYEIKLFENGKDFFLCVCCKKARPCDIGYNAARNGRFYDSDQNS